MGVRHTIGASEVAVALGYQRRKGDGEPYISEYELWCRLTGRIARYDGEDSPDAQLGRMCEVAVANEWMRRRRLRPGQDVLPGPQLNDDGWGCRCHPWLHARPDLLLVPVVGPAGHRYSDFHRREPVELKAPRELDEDRWGEDGTDQMPEEYLVQLVVQVHVCGAARGHLAAMARAPRNDRVWAEYEWARDDELIESVLAKAKEWYDHFVVGDREPPLDGSASSRWALDRRWKPKRDDVTVWASVDTEETVRSLHQVREAAHEREHRAFELQQHVMAAMGEATVLRGGKAGRILATWRVNKDGVRVFRLLPMEG